jgi:protein-S-isoprenylcysteine O-methyltransferase Ste14
MKTKKAWAIFSGIGFALMAIFTIDAVRVKPSIDDLINFIAIAIMGIGICISVYTGVILSIKKGSLNTTGIYNVVRHPLYLSGIVWAIGLIILSLSTLSISRLIGAVLAIVCFILVSRMEDNYNIEKFGKDYEEYMEKVPALNFLKYLRKNA